MPRYDYACERCGHTVEVIHGVHQPGPTRCERCGGEMRKLLSTPTFVFKGSGWAKNDARAAWPTGAAKSATDTDADHQPAAAAGTPKAEPDSNSKPAQSGDSSTAKATRDTASAADS